MLKLSIISIALLSVFSVRVSGVFPFDAPGLINPFSMLNNIQSQVGDMINFQGAVPNSGFATGGTTFVSSGGLGQGVGVGNSMFTGFSSDGVGVTNFQGAGPNTGFVSGGTSFVSSGGSGIGGGGGFTSSTTSGRDSDGNLFYQTISQRTDGQTRYFTVTFKYPSDGKTVVRHYTLDLSNPDAKMVETEDC